MARNLFTRGGSTNIENTKSQIQNFLNDNPTANPLFFNDNRKTIWTAPDGGNNLDNILEFGGTVQPIMEKTYSNYTCGTGNDQYIFFINLIPDSDKWTDVYSIRYKLIVNTDEENCQGEYDCYFSFSGSTVIYANFNKFYSSSYYPIYAHYLLRYDTKAKFNNKSQHPIKVGLRLASAYLPTTKARNYTIQIYELNNCTATFVDSIETYTNIFNAANYTNSEYNGASLGLQESGDSTETSSIVMYYTHLKAGANGIKQKSLIMKDSTGSWQSFTTTDGTGTKTKNSVGFIPGSNIYYYNSTTNRAASEFTGNGTIYAHANLIDFRYSTNCEKTLVSNKPIYIKGTINNSDGLFYLADTWWTQTEPTIRDNFIYIKVSGGAYDTYRADLISDGTMYWYDDEAFRVYGLGNGSGGSSLQNMVYNSGIKLGQYLDEDENPHDIFTPNPLLNMAYSTGIRIGSYVSATGNKDIFIPEPISTIYNDGTTIGTYKTSSGTSNIWIPISKVASMPQNPSNDMIYIVSDMANGTTNPDTPGSGANDYVTNARMEDYINNQSFITLNVLNNYLNTASYISSIPDGYVQQIQLDESAYITQDYLDEVGYITSTDIESAINTAYNNSRNYTDSRITSLIDGAPAALDTLSEIASALNNNPNMGTALTNQITSIKSDLNSYVKTISLNGVTYNSTNNNINLGNLLTSHAAHKLNVTNSSATNTTGTITFVESLTGTNTATSNDLSLTATRKSITIPSIGTLKTDNIASQEPSSLESFSGPIFLHKVAKTGKYTDLVDAPNPNNFITSHASHKLTVTPGNASANSGNTITFVETATGTNTATSGDLSLTLTRKTATIPSVGTLKTDNTTSQTGRSESFGGTINLHVISKTGDYNDLINKPTIPSGSGTLNTEISTSQETNGSESLSGNISLHKIAKSGKYSDLIDPPTIPQPANNGTLTIQRNGTTVATFGANNVTNVNANITVPDLPSYSASDSGKILSVNSSGQLVWITPVSIYSGTGEPLDSLGLDGDIYVQN